MRRALHCVMIILLIFLCGSGLSFSRTENLLHEWCGILLFALVIVHLVWNRKWFIGVFRGKYNTNRILINVPSFDMVETVVGVGTVHGSECNKFDAFGLDRAKAKKVKAPVITNCLAAVECKLEDYIEHHGILVFKGVQLWENPDKEERRVIHANGDGTFFADGEFRNLRNEMSQWVPEGSERL